MNKQQEETASFIVMRIQYQKVKDVLIQKRKEKGGLSKDGKAIYNKMKDYGCYQCKCCKSIEDIESGADVVVCEKECILEKEVF